MRERAPGRGVRTFVAVQLPEELRAALGRLQDRLHVPGIPVKWVEPDLLHLTLKFLGDVPVERLDAVFRGVERAAVRATPFEIVLNGVGAFPNARRPRVVWVGVSEGADTLADLAAAVDEALEIEGFPKEEKPFRSHATLGRVKERSRAVAALGAKITAEAPAFEGFRVETIHIMRSTLTRRGPIYRVQREVALAGGEGSG